MVEKAIKMRNLLIKNKRKTVEYKGEKYYISYLAENYLIIGNKLGKKKFKVNYESLD